MRLRDLDGHFFALVGGRSSLDQDSVNGAQGVRFQCPKCGEGLPRGEENGRRFIVGAHYIQVCFANPQGAAVAPAEFDKNPRWAMTGNSLDDLTTKPSINCDIPWKDENGVEHPSSCKFHGWITAGDVA